MDEKQAQRRLSPDEIRAFYAELRRRQLEAEHAARNMTGVTTTPTGTVTDAYGNTVTKLPDDEAWQKIMDERDPASGDPHRQWRGFKAQFRPESGGKMNRSGFGALASMRDEYGRPVYAGSNQRARLLAERGNSEDVRDSFTGRMAQLGRNSLTEKSEEGSFLHNLASSGWGSTLTGAGIGAGVGALGAYLAGKVGLDILSPATASMIGAGLGGATGYKVNRVYTGKDELPNMDMSWMVDNAKEKAMQAAGLGKKASVEKKASMYQDPRNFILEKLQRDNELSMADKAALAGKIRSMSLGEASQLETLVRGALGIGVGALIAKFFGFGLMGSLVGAGLGAYALTRFSERKPQFGAIFDNGGDGFSTYNEFLGATYF